MLLLLLPKAAQSLNLIDLKIMILKIYFKIIIELRIKIDNMEAQIKYCKNLKLYMNSTLTFICELYNLI